MATTASPPLAAPRSPRRVGPRRVNTELWGWLFMRLSGLVLVVLVTGHLFVNLMLDEGIKGVDFAFVAGKYASPFWQMWAVIMLWLAQLHGTNGMRTIIDDYAERDQTRFWLKAALYAATVLVLALGTYTVFTFDPCLEGSTFSGCR